MARRVLFVTWAGGGNVNPLVALGAQLVARGHQVRVLGDVSLESRFEADSMMYAGTVGDVAVELERERPDVVVVDYMLPVALCTAEVSALPYVAFVHTLYSAQAIADHSPMHMGGDTAHVNHVRSELGLEPVARVPELLDHADLVMVTTTAELDDRHGRLPANVRFVGPIVEDPGPDANWIPPWPPSDTRPLVVVSMGTTPMDERPVIERVIAALGELPVRALVTVGDHLDPSSFASPDNVVVREYTRHAVVLPEARLFVTHAGLSGIGTALREGVPMVCIPLGREQPANAEHVAALGVGRVVGPDATVPELHAVIAAALADDALRTHAQLESITTRAHGNGASAVDEIERLQRR